MTIAAIEKKIAPILPRGEKTLKRFVKDALFLQLQEVSKKSLHLRGNTTAISANLNGSGKNAAIEKGIV